MLYIYIKYLVALVKSHQLILGYFSRCLWHLQHVGPMAQCSWLCHFWWHLKFNTKVLSELRKNRVCDPVWWCPTESPAALKAIVPNLCSLWRSQPLPPFLGNGYRQHSQNLGSENVLINHWSGYDFSWSDTHNAYLLNILKRWGLFSELLHISKSPR